jgi:MoxR-like ATPase
VTSQLDPAVRKLALNFGRQLRRIKDEFVERDTAVEVIALAALCREHVLLIGPPGTAKTGVLERFSHMLRARYFRYLLTKFTEPDELFGTIDVPSFHAGQLRLKTDGMLPRAQIAFLDEVFNGSSAILNTLLTLINERTFQNGPQRETADLITLLGASNDIPDDPMLRAFCDRFLFRYSVHYVSDESVGDVLELGWSRERAAFEPAEPAPDMADFPLGDLVRLQRAIGDIDLGPVQHTLISIVRAFRDEDVSFSDRRAVKAQKAIAAKALLDARNHAELSDLSVLGHLWSDPGDELTIRQVIKAHDVPEPARDGAAVDLDELKNLIYKTETELPLMESAEEVREIQRRLGRWLADVRDFHPEQEDLLESIGRLQAQALTRLSELDHH